ncbi:MAG: HlyC/CorC family transporter [Acidobacteria bacterium]|nr:HlyC/CorC family transporter [Acidobacteriota bacterium]
MSDPIPSEAWTQAGWLAAIAGALALHVLLAIVVGAGRTLGSLAAERLSEQSGLKDTLEPGSASFTAVAGARQLALLAAVGLAGFAPVPWAGGWTAAGAGLVALVAGWAGEAFLAPRAPERILRATAPLVRLLGFPLRPVVAPLAKLHESFVAATRRERVTADDEVREEAIEEYLRDAEEEGLIEQEQGKLLREVVEFGDTVVREVMTPRTNIDAVQADDTVAEMYREFARSRRSRLLVHEGGLDHVVGVIALRDILAYLSPAANGVRARDLMRPVAVIPSSKNVLELLRELQQERQQIAAVVDEYGGTAGLVTLEDLVEEIVGEIRDEHERDQAVQLAEGGFVADGLMSIEQLEQLLDREVPAEGVETVGGLVFTKLGRLPRVGEKVMVAPNLEIEVVRMRGRRIAAVRVHPVTPSPAAPPVPTRGDR